MADVFEHFSHWRYSAKAKSEAYDVEIIASQKNEKKRYVSFSSFYTDTDNEPANKILNIYKL
jgi:hypothetical protein